MTKGAVVKMPIEEGMPEPDIGALANDIVAGRKALTEAQRERDKWDDRTRELREGLKAATARLMEAINGPSTKRGPKATTGPRWPLAAHAKSQAMILRALDDVGPIQVAEMRKEFPGITDGVLSQALQKLLYQGMIEKLKDGAYALTQAQRDLMRV